MRKAAFAFAGAAVLLCAGPPTAQAAPGAKILTAGAAQNRTETTPGVTHETVNGVNIYRGGAASPGAVPAPGAAPLQPIEIEIAPCRCDRGWRSLRTQGFYSGKVYRSRRYTQGFYSGR